MGSYRQMQWPSWYHDLGPRGRGEGLRRDGLPLESLPTRPAPASDLRVPLPRTSGPRSDPPTPSPRSSGGARAPPSPEPSQRKLCFTPRPPGGPLRSSPGLLPPRPELSLPAPVLRPRPQPPNSSHRPRGSLTLNLSFRSHLIPHPQVRGGSRSNGQFPILAPPWRPNHGCSSRSPWG